MEQEYFKILKNKKILKENGKIMNYKTQLKYNLECLNIMEKFRIFNCMEKEN